MTACLIVRAEVAEADREAFDRWYEAEHLPDAKAAFQCLSARRGWSDGTPGVHFAIYEFASLERGPRGCRRLAGDHCPDCRVRPGLGYPRGPDARGGGVRTGAVTEPDGSRHVLGQFPIGWNHLTHPLSRRRQGSSPGFVTRCPPARAWRMIRIDRPEPGRSGRSGRRPSGWCAWAALGIGFNTSGACPAHSGR